ncbi:Metallo-hydrolase/oxidoreductase [Mycena rebaudengoi]|nr:Metallo-hydrolase/oxidoreductase [Mycena rebaudengoi]
MKFLSSLVYLSNSCLRKRLPQFRVSLGRPTPTARAYSSAGAPFQFHPSRSADSPVVYSFFERNTSTCQYIVSCPVTKDAALIDTVLDYEPSSAHISTSTADEIVSFIRKHGLNIKYILETHAHADHLTAAQYHRRIFNAAVGIGKRISMVQETFAPMYGFKPSELENSFDILFEDEEDFKLGDLRCRVIHLPGHTPDHVGYMIGQTVFTGDSIFMPDVGSARSDFPGGDARMLYSSMQRLMALPESYQLFVGHDYPVNRDRLCVTTVGKQLKSNKHSRRGVAASEFITFRQARDSILGTPSLFHPSLQTNIRGGRLPAKEGRIVFKIPATTSIEAL